MGTAVATHPEEIAQVITFDREGLRAVYAFPPNAILDVEHIALWLGVKPSTAVNLPIKWIPLSAKGKHRFMRRAFAKHVIQFLEELAK